MALIPGIPTLDPVQKPFMSPREAGKPGMAVAELGEESEVMAQEDMQIAGRMRQAQKSVDQIAFQNQAKAAFDQYQVELKKTQNSRDIPDLVTKTRDEFNALTKQWAKSPAYREIQQQADSLIPEVSTHGQLRSIDLMGKEWNAQIDIQKQTLLPQLATAIRNGDTEQADYIKGLISHQYDQAEKNGLISASDRKLDMAAQQIIVRKQLNEAAITSANPAERQAAIKQLGGHSQNGPLDLTSLAPGDIGALREHAIETDQTLTRLSEAQNLNAKLNIAHNAFQAPEFKNNFEAQQKALDDPQWLKQHGIVDENGQPDFVLAEKLSSESVRQEEFRKKEQVDKDEKVIEQFSPAIDENKMTRAQIDSLPTEAEGGISNRARALLVRQWTQNNTINRQMATMDRQEAARSMHEISDGNMVDMYSRIASGELVDPLEVRTAAGLTKEAKTQLLGAIQTAKAEPDFRGAISILNDSIPIIKEPKNTTPEQHDLFVRQNARATEEYNETLSAYNQEMKDHPGQNKQEAMRKVLEPVNHKRISDLLDQRFGSDSKVKPSLWDRWTKEEQRISGEDVSPVKKFKERVSALLGTEDSAPAPTAEPPAIAPTGPKKGDHKKNSNGDDVIYDGTKWKYQ